MEAVQREPRHSTHTHTHSHDDDAQREPKSKRHTPRRECDRPLFLIPGRLVGGVDCVDEDGESFYLLRLWFKQRTQVRGERSSEKTTAASSSDVCGARRRRRCFAFACLQRFCEAARRRRRRRTTTDDGDQVQVLHYYNYTYKTRQTGGPAAIFSVCSLLAIVRLKAKRSLHLAIARLGSHFLTSLPAAAVLYRNFSSQPSTHRSFASPESPVTFLSHFASISSTALAVYGFC